MLFLFNILQILQLHFPKTQKLSVGYLSLQFKLLASCVLVIDALCYYLLANIMK
jgi:hypothetical protein